MQPVVKHGSDELKARDAAPHRQRRPARLLRRHRTRCGPGHLAHHHLRQARGRPLPHQRPQGVDLQGAGVGEDPAADPHHAVRRGDQEDRRHDAVPDRPRPRPRRHPARSRRWAATPSAPTSCSSTTCIVPVEDRVGEEGKGFKYILDGLNPERMLIAAEALGIGRVALEKAVKYGNERVVFNRPIGMNQGLQFPLADSLARLDAAELVLRKATWLYDNGKPCGREANTAKYLCADAGFGAADRALQTARRDGLLRGIPRVALLPRVAADEDRAGQPGDDPELPRRARARDCRGATDGVFRTDRPLGDGDGGRCRRGDRRGRRRRPGRSGRRSARHRHQRRCRRCRGSTHSKRRWQGGLVRPGRGRPRRRRRRRRTGRRAGRGSAAHPRQQRRRHIARHVRES